MLEMSQSDAVKEEVLASASIELERMFTVLSILYSEAKFPEHARFLPAVEDGLRECLREMTQKEVPSFKDPGSDQLLAQHYQG